MYKLVKISELNVNRKKKKGPDAYGITMTYDPSWNT